MVSGADLHKQINERMIGKMALTYPETDIFLHYMGREGDHVEIGCLWGGTAIFAALAKIENGVSGDVYTIDRMREGYWIYGDPNCNKAVPTLEKVKQNLNTFGIEDRVKVIVAESNPLPLPDNVRPRTALIDGGHAYENCHKDWLNLRKVVSDLILFHDYATGRHPGVQKVVDDIIREDKDWVKIEHVDYLVVFERVRK